MLRVAVTSTESECRLFRGQITAELEMLLRDSALQAVPGLVAFVVSSGWVGRQSPNQRLWWDRVERNRYKSFGPGLGAGFLGGGKTRLPQSQGISCWHRSRHPLAKISFYGARVMVQWVEHLIIFFQHPMVP